jgi:hypothetical protein
LTNESHTFFLRHTIASIGIQDKWTNWEGKKQGENLKEKKYWTVIVILSDIKYFGKFLRLRPHKSDFSGRIFFQISHLPSTKPRGANSDVLMVQRITWPLGTPTFHWRSDTTYSRQIAVIMDVPRPSRLLLKRHIKTSILIEVFWVWQVPRQNKGEWVKSHQMK